VLLTLDLGTSATKAAVWGRSGPVAVGRAEVPTFHPEPGWAEQDPDDWWQSVVEACAAARAQAPEAWAEVEAVGFSAARETFVPVTGDGRALGPGLLWSDRRAEAEAATLAEAGGGVEAVRAATGVVVDAGTMAAKVAWLAGHDPDRMAAGRWLLAPRDLVVLRLTGQVATDPTLASRTGFYRLDGHPLAAVSSNGLPPVVPSTHAFPLAAGDLGLAPGLPVVLGAGDRACEVLGTGATAERPMVSWGTTANLSVPLDAVPDPLPAGLAVSRGARAGFLLEAGLSASGAALAWLARLTGRTHLELADAAARAPAGARGVVALPWLNGARAPWWRPGARAAFLNLTPAHGPGDLARAVFEAVAFDVARSLEAVATPVASLVAAGGGVAGGLWVDLLAAVTGLPVVLRRSGEAGSAGACLIAATAIGADGWHVDAVNPVVGTTVPERGLAAYYRQLRPLSDRVANGVLDLDVSEWSTAWT
jgi:xylulokinase